MVGFGLGPGLTAALVLGSRVLTTLVGIAITPLFCRRHRNTSNSDDWDAGDLALPAAVCFVLLALDGCFLGLLVLGTRLQPFDDVPLTSVRSIKVSLSTLPRTK